jgi:hypothetical protein
MITMSSVQAVKAWLEYLGGVGEHEPVGWPSRWSWLLMGIWWSVALIGITCFCGQTSKFIYIDF